MKIASKKIKVELSLLAMLLTMSLSMAQTTINLEDCYRLSKQHYPLIKKQELIAKSNAYSIQNLQKGYLPQFNISGQASYQSAVTQIPIQLPNTHIPSLDKDQYRLYGEVSQVLLDGGVIKSEKQSEEIATKVEKQQLEVELYKIRERINELYFGILLIDQQLHQNSFLKEDIQLGINKILAAVRHETALKSSADGLKAELLKAEQQRIEMQATRKAFMDVLSLFIQQDLREHTVLVKPLPPSYSGAINKPEVRLFDLQRQHVQTQQALLRAKNMPKFNLFAQGGAGRPALNMLSNTFEAFYIVGLQMNLPISGFYTLKNDKALINIKQQEIQLQKETFLFNTRMELKQQDAVIAKYQTLLLSDDEIITLRSNVKKTALVQLENGVITSNDYLRETIAENQARQQKAFHEMQLLMAMYTQKTNLGN